MKILRLEYKISPEIHKRLLYLHDLRQQYACVCDDNESDLNSREELDEKISNLTCALKHNEYVPWWVINHPEYGGLGEE